MAGIEIEQIFRDLQHLSRKAITRSGSRRQLNSVGDVTSVCLLGLQRLGEHKQKKIITCPQIYAQLIHCSPYASEDIAQLIQANGIYWSVILMLSAAWSLCVKGISATVLDA